MNRGQQRPYCVCTRPTEKIELGQRDVAKKGKKEEEKKPSSHATLEWTPDGVCIIPHRHLRSSFVIKRPISPVTPKEGTLRADVPNAKTALRCRDSTLTSVLRHCVGQGCELRVRIHMPTPPKN